MAVIGNKPGLTTIFKEEAEIYSKLKDQLGEIYKNLTIPIVKDCKTPSEDYSKFSNIRQGLNDPISNLYLIERDQKYFFIPEFYVGIPVGCLNPPFEHTNLRLSVSEIVDCNQQKNQLLMSCVLQSDEYRINTSLFLHYFLIEEGEEILNKIYRDAVLKNFLFRQNAAAEGIVTWVVSEGFRHPELYLKPRKSICAITMLDKHYSHTLSSYLRDFTRRILARHVFHSDKKDQNVDEKLIKIYQFMLSNLEDAATKYYNGLTKEWFLISTDPFDYGLEIVNGEVAAVTLITVENTSRHTILQAEDLKRVINNPSGFAIQFASVGGANYADGYVARREFIITNALNYCKARENKEEPWKFIKTVFLFTAYMELMDVIEINRGEILRRIYADSDLEQYGFYREFKRRIGVIVDDHSDKMWSEYIKVRQ